MRTAIVWFRNDLRLADNPALQAALQAERVVPVYVHAPEEAGDWAPGGASRWWLHHSLTALDRDLRALGSRLVLRRGPSLPALLDLARETGAGALYWNRRYEPSLVECDRQVKSALRAAGLHAESHQANLLFEPRSVATGAGKPFRVFTPFWRACLTRGLPGPPLPPPETLPPVPAGLPSLPLEALALRPRSPWDGGLQATWTPGTAGALEQLRAFVEGSLGQYREARDWPAKAGTSRLSPHLHFGELSPRQVAWAARTAVAHEPEASAGLETYLRELGWREFGHHVLFHFPHTAGAPLDERFADFPRARDHTDLLRAWQQGRTGIPMVDAGMRELWHTGWMHNRVRMLVASFLTKNGLVPWLAGARWFWDTLVDADLANNTLGWQWTAGCGADAAPYFRIFNPVLQGQKFDPEGSYVRRWLPELARLPAAWIHHPWEAPAAVLAQAGLRPGRDYPSPVLDLAESRRAALAAFGALRTP